MPVSLHQAFTAVLRYTIRSYGYLYLLTDVYPAGLFGDAPIPRAGAVPPTSARLRDGSPRPAGPYPGWAPRRRRARRTPPPAGYSTRRQRAAAPRRQRATAPAASRVRSAVGGIPGPRPPRLGAPGYPAPRPRQRGRATTPLPDRTRSGTGRRDTGRRDTGRRIRDAGIRDTVAARGPGPEAAAPWLAASAPGPPARNSRSQRAQELVGLVLVLGLLAGRRGRVAGAAISAPSRGTGRSAGSTPTVASTTRSLSSSTRSSGSTMPRHPGTTDRRPGERGHHRGDRRADRP